MIIWVQLVRKTRTYRMENIVVTKEEQMWIRMVMRVCGIKETTYPILITLSFLLQAIE